MKPTTTDDVFDLLDAYVTSAALGAAMESGLFWLLKEQPLDVAGVARALGIPINRCRYWLQILSSQINSFTSSPINSSSLNSSPANWARASTSSQLASRAQ